MKGIKIFALGLGYSVTAGLSVASGVASAGLIPPRVTSGDEESVTVKTIHIQNEPNVRLVADEHCNKYGRTAQLVEDHGFGRFTFECVKSASATPAQSENDEIPAEETVESESQSDEKCTVEQVLKLKDAGLSNDQIQAACE